MLEKSNLLIRIHFQELIVMLILFEFIYFHNSIWNKPLHALNKVIISDSVFMPPSRIDSNPRWNLLYCFLCIFWINYWNINFKKILLIRRGNYCFRTESINPYSHNVPFLYPPYLSKHANLPRWIAQKLSSLFLGNWSYGLLIIINY